MRNRKALLRFLVIIFLIGIILSSCNLVRSSSTVSGTVLDEENDPIAGATVRVKTTELFAKTDQQGHFILHSDQPVKLTAFSPGYYIAGGDETFPPGSNRILITLKAHHDSDHSEYEWLSAFSDAGEEGNCQNCHFDLSDANAALPFTEWQQDAHGLSTQNVRFLTMYTGQDMNGNQSPFTRFVLNRDYGSFPLRPDSTQPYYGPGYKLDFPESAGNCSACHAPAAAIDAAYDVDPTIVDGVGAEGVACDFCHKIWDVRLDSDTGLPYPNMPGVLSFEFRRPPEGHQFFAGPLDDVAPGEDTYSSLQQQSQFCAPCHFGMFWDTPIYNSFGEWLESPYSVTKTGKTCQDCHMPSGQNDHFALMDVGGETRDPMTIFSHRMPGAEDEVLLQNAVTLTVDAQRIGRQVVVETTILNDLTGHHVPTDSPLRQMILLVQVTDSKGMTLEQLEGPVIPEEGGVGNPKDGFYAGQPGQVYAKQLRELWTEVTPTGAYWNPTSILSDNRIPAMESDTTRYVFATTGITEFSDITVSVKLLFRRAFIELMIQKGWQAPDIMMESDTLVIP